MKTICSLLCFLMIAAGSHPTIAQSIRKDYREFTAQEMEDYQDALETMRQSGMYGNLTFYHDNHYLSAIHTTSGNTGEYFLPWHRFFLLDFEWELRNGGSQYAYLSVPYWDWRVDRSNAGSSHWNNDFLSATNLPNFTFSRSFTNSDGSGYLGTTSEMDACLALSTFWTNTTAKTTTSSDFSHRAEAYNDLVHSWIGGTMTATTSPKDPVFYLHHNFIDKLWQEWEDQSTGLQSSFSNGSVGMPHYNTVDLYSTDVLADNLKDSRSLTKSDNSPISSRNWDVWYAYQGKVLLNGANNSDFVCNDATTPYLYRYTKATTTGGSTVAGDMYVGDVKRDASDNVVGDTKGGFRVETNVSCDFRSGGSIHFQPGFRAKAGSIVHAKIISTPNGFNRQGEVASEDTRSEKQLVQVTPNPARDYLFLNLIIPHSTSLRYTVYDVVGTQVYQAEQQLTKGSHQVGVDCRQFATGSYIIMLAYDEEVKATTFIVQH